MTAPKALRIIKHSRPTPDNVVIKFATEDGSILHYLPGQFLVFTFEINGKEIRRSYSLFSSPVTGEAPAIAVKLVENGEITKLLHHKVAVGDVMQALQPNGTFTYLPKESGKRTIFMFAAGIGITPIYAILKTALILEPAASIVLIYSNKNVENTLFYDELNQLKEQYGDRFKLIFIFSEAKNLLLARLNNVWIAQIVKDHLMFDPEDALFYTCGPINYMVLCRITLRALGFSQDQIKRETYFIPEDEADDDDMTEKEPADTNTYAVIIEHRGQTYQFDVPYHQRILQAALEQDINLPYSCAAGICSSCTGTCTEGGVRMEYNEVLTDEEVARGRVLICTGHPTANHTRIVIE